MSTPPANLSVSCLLPASWDEASVQRAAGECRERLGTAPDLVIALATSDYRPHLAGLIEALRLDGRAGRIIGASGSGLFGVGREIENASGLSLLFLSMPDTTVEILDGRCELKKSRLLDEAPAGFVVLADPLLSGLQGPLREFNALFPGVPVIGGMVSGGPSEQDLFLFSGDGNLEEPFVAAGFGGNVRMEPLVAQSCRPIGEPLVVTGTRANVVHSIAGRSPYAVLEETFTSLEEAFRHSAEGNIFAGLAVREEVDDFSTGDFVIRNIVGTDLSDGKLVLTSPPRVGQTLQFQLRDAAVAEHSLRGELRRLSGAGEDAPFAGLFCGGIGRGASLYGDSGRDVAILEEILGPVPLAGWFGNGEFGPVGGVNYRHDQALCGALFYRV